MGIALTFFGIVVAILGLIGFRRFQSIEKEARESVEVTNEHLEEAKRSNEEAKELLEESRRYRDEVKDIRDETAETAADEPERVKQVAEDVREDPQSPLIDKAIADAISLQQDQKLEEAIEKWQAIVKIAEGSDNKLTARAWFSVGYLLLEQGKHEEGIAANDKALALNPELSMAYHNRGNGKRVLGRHEDAIVDYDKALSLRPDYSLAYYNRGNANATLLLYDEAIADYDKALSLNPKITDDAYSNRGNAKLVLGYPKDAISDHSRAISLNPANFVAYAGRGHSYVVLGEIEAARRDFEKARDLARAVGDEDLAASVEQDLQKLDEQ